METITRKPYETDLTDDEWAILEPVLKRALYGEKTKTRGHPRHYPLREIVNAILYVLKTGCQWRNLPTTCPRGRPSTITFGGGRSEACWRRYAIHWSNRRGRRRAKRRPSI
jgi:transposase